MDRFLCIQAFVRVAETEGFATAARQLGVTPSVITSRIKQLELFFQAPLFVDFIRKRFSGEPEWDQALHDVIGMPALAKA
jgi:Bacterial regulatory helix-turn-helix protein, lysR family